MALTIDVRLSFSTVSFSLLAFLIQVLFEVVSKVLNSVYRVTYMWDINYLTSLFCT